jgi:uncharacterized membrane-anchored protein YitT (DUF2179 family)
MKPAGGFDMNKQNKKAAFSAMLWEYAWIVIGSLLYAFSTVAFIFPGGLLLGGTSGISVILTAFLPFSPGIILVAINVVLMLLAFLILGKEMAIKTFVGSTLTTIFIGVLEAPMGAFSEGLISQPYLSAIVGALIIAVASGVMFFVDSSSGGTDIIALIVKKFSGIRIGRALLITDVLIVLVGGALLGWTILISSCIGFLVKVFGIDLVIRLLKRGK